MGSFAITIARQYCLFLLFWVSPCLPAWAQTELSWQQAVSLLSAQNPELVAAHSAVQAAEQRLSEARRNLFIPELTLTFSAGHSWLTSPAQSTLRTPLRENPRASNETSTVESTSFVGRVALTQPLFSGFADVARLAQAEQNLRIERENVRALKAKLSHTLASHYQDLLSSQEFVTLSESILKRRTENLRLVQLRFEGGRENRGAVLLLEATAEQSRTELTQARRAAQLAGLQLASILGLSAASSLPLRVREKIPLALSENPALPSFENWQLWSRATPEFAIAEARVQAAQAALRESRSQFYPRLSLRASAERSGEEFFPRSQTLSVSAEVSFALLSRSESVASLQAHSALLAAAQSTLTGVEDSARLRIQQAHSALQTAAERLRVSGTFLEAARLRAEIGRSQYENGLLSFENWDAIEREFTNQQRSQVTYLKELVVAQSALLQARGEGVLP